eukprot:m51a1_g10021 hypothetical protein (295) ;mRNA; f:74158-78811
MSWRALTVPSAAVSTTAATTATATTTAAEDKRSADEAEAERLTLEALAEADRRRCGAACELLVRALDLRPAFIPALLLLRTARADTPEALARSPRSAEFSIDALLRRAQAAPDGEKEAARRFVLETAGDSPMAQTLAATWYSRLLDDTESAVRLWRLSAVRGCPPAMCSLGYYLNNRRDGDTDHSAALELYQRASDAGHAQATVNLGVCREKGQGCAPDPGEAVRLYREAADRGHSQGLSCLAWLLSNGVGTPADKREAVRMYEAAVSHGDLRAMHNLAVMTHRGDTPTGTVFT